MRITSRASPAISKAGRRGFRTLEQPSKSREREDVSCSKRKKKHHRSVHLQRHFLWWWTRRLFSSSRYTGRTFFLAHLFHWLRVRTGNCISFFFSASLRHTTWPQHRRACIRRSSHGFCWLLVVPVAASTTTIKLCSGWPFSLRQQVWKIIFLIYISCLFCTHKPELQWKHAKNIIVPFRIAGGSLYSPKLMSGLSCTGPSTNSFWSFVVHGEGILKASRTFPKTLS